MARDPRAVWAEITTRRRELHQQTGVDSMELMEAADTRWHTCLEGAYEAAWSVRADPYSDVDPRAALIDLMAVTLAWIDAMDGRTPHASPTRPGLPAWATSTATPNAGGAGS